MEDHAWMPFQWHCPNCGHIVIGYKNTSGVVKVECKICHVAMVRKFKGKNHDTIDVYMPQSRSTFSHLEAV